MATAALWLALAVLGAVPGACDGPSASASGDRTIPREAFVEAMVELRLGAARRPDHRITPGDRDRILAERGLTGRDLIRFAEVHGGNVPWMNEVWLEIEARLQAYVEALEQPEGEEEEGPSRIEPPRTPPGRISGSGS